MGRPVLLCLLGPHLLSQIVVWILPPQCTNPVLFQVRSNLDRMGVLNIYSLGVCIAPEWRSMLRDMKSPLSFGFGALSSFLRFFLSGPLVLGPFLHFSGSFYLVLWFWGLFFIFPVLFIRFFFFSFFSVIQETKSNRESLVQFTRASGRAPAEPRKQASSHSYVVRTSAVNDGSLD